MELRSKADETLELAGKFKGILKYKDIVELEEKQEEYLKRREKEDIEPYYHDTTQHHAHS